MNEDFLPPLKKKDNPKKDLIHCHVCQNIDMLIAILASVVILLTV